MYRSIAERNFLGRGFLNSWEEFWGAAGCGLERREERRRVGRGDGGRGELGADAACAGEGAGIWGAADGWPLARTVRQFMGGPFCGEREWEGCMYRSISERGVFGRGFLNSWEESWGAAGCGLERREERRRVGRGDGGRGELGADAACAGEGAGIWGAADGWPLARTVRQFMGGPFCAQRVLQWGLGFLAEEGSPNNSSMSHNFKLQWGLGFLAEEGCRRGGRSGR